MTKQRLGLVTVALLACVSMSATARPQTASVRIIEISAERFEFWPSEVVVHEGEEVELRITSDDTMHGFRLAGGRVSLSVPKRGKGYASARFTGVEPGRYTFECSRMCGAGHHFMRGTLVVRAASSQADR